METLFSRYAKVTNLIMAGLPVYRAVSLLLQGGGLEMTAARGGSFLRLIAGRVRSLGRAACGRRSAQVCSVRLPSWMSRMSYGAVW